MPELPEVHTTVEGIKKYVVGKTIEEAWSDFHVGTAHGERQNIKNKKYWEDFKKKVRGAKIKSVGRIGKNILINLVNDQTIIVHMKMTGHLMVKGFEKEKKFIHFIFTLSGGKKLILSDMRKFASVEIVPTKEVEKHLSLGPNPLLISQKEFAERVAAKKSVPVKAVLMDQKVLAGLGNIYSDEILWATGVHPLSHADKIPAKKYKEMFEAMKKILKFSISRGGDSHSDYRNALGQKGGFQNFHRAYGRRGKKCPKKNCGGIIQRMVVRGRSAHFCPKHQIKY